MIGSYLYSWLGYFSLHMRVHMPHMSSLLNLELTSFRARASQSPEHEPTLGLEPANSAAYLGPQSWYWHESSTS